MNHIIAQGAPGSLIRRLQESPEIAVDALSLLADLALNADRIKPEFAERAESIIRRATTGLPVAAFSLYVKDESK